MNHDVTYRKYQCCGALRGGAVRSQFSPQPGRWGGAKPFCAPGWGVGAGRSHFAPRLGRWGGAKLLCAPGWGVGAGRLCFLGPLVRPTPRGACTAPVITNMKFENIFLLIFFTKKEVRNWNLENIFYWFLQENRLKSDIIDGIMFCRVNKCIKL